MAKRRSVFAGLRLLMRLWPWIMRRKKSFIIVVALAPFSALFLMLLPNTIRLAIDEGMQAGDASALTLYIFMFVGIFVAEFAVLSLQRYLMAVLVQRVVRDLRHDLANHLITLPAAFHDRQLSGVLVTRATSDFDALSESLGHGVFGAAADLVALAGSLAALVMISGPLVFIALAFLPVVGCLIGLFSRSLQKAMLFARAKLAVLNGFTQECVAACATIHTLAAEDDAERRFESASNAYRDAQMKSVILDSVLNSIIEGLSAIALGVLLYFAFSSRAITPGVLIASVACLQQIFEPLREFSNRIAVLQGVFTSIERIFGLLDTRIACGGDTLPVASRGMIGARDLSFAYTAPDGGPGRGIIHALSFQARSGESVALVGATGSGKTTFARLLAAEYDSYSGSLAIDGAEVSGLNAEAHRSRLGIVPQDPEIFQGTIAFNISLGREGIDAAAVEEAACAVGADRFIARLPLGYASHLDENGVNLSQGERQLIVFARAIVNKPAMLILDEATSSLDAASERLVQTAMEALFRDRTVIVIAHRLATVRKCDRILVIEEGRIAEEGTHHELLRAHGIYYAMLRAFVDREKRSRKPV
ncbi:MAG: ABC transporter ATP-binding protein/permease [Spirochaetota bacterium]|nr:ABC transporter ATP-binding protein/permease [Spirochaetota bacterium]